MKKIVLFGAGGLGREIASTIEAINRIEKKYDFLGFIVEGKYYKPDSFADGYPILGDENWLLSHKDVYCTCTIADVNAKKRIQEYFEEKGINFETIISPLAKVNHHSYIGSGCVIYPHVLISTNVKLGKGVLLNSYVTIGHDATIGDYSNVMPTTGISGNVHIGEQVNIGGHAFIVPKKKIGDKAVVAAGSIVFSNVKAGTTVLGNPAKRMRTIED